MILYKRFKILIIHILINKGLLQQHKKGAIQNTGRRWQRLHAHVLQSDTRGLAVEARRQIQDMEEEMVHIKRRMSLLLRINSRKYFDIIIAQLIGSII